MAGCHASVIFRQWLHHVVHIAGAFASYAYLMGYRFVSHDTDGMQENIWWTLCASRVRDTQMSILKYIYIYILYIIYVYICVCVCVCESPCTIEDDVTLYVRAWLR